MNLRMQRLHSTIKKLGKASILLNRCPWNLVSLQSRDAIFTKLGARISLDVLVIGGGEIGALVARDAALRGSRVLVVERGFFGDRAERWRGRFSLSLRSEVARMLVSALRIRSVSRRILGDLTEISPIDPDIRGDGQTDPIPPVLGPRSLSMRRL